MPEKSLTSDGAMQWIRNLFKRHEHEWVRAEDTRQNGPYMYIPVVCKGCGETAVTWKASWADPE